MTCLFSSVPCVPYTEPTAAAVADAVAIWTHVAGQATAAAPSPLAFVTAILHGNGSFVPVAGMGTIPLALARAASESGVEFRLGTKVSAIRREAGRAMGVTTTEGELIEADAVVADCNGVGTYLELVRDAVPASGRRRLEGLPLQSPGVCLPAVRDGRTPPYLRFRLRGNGELAAFWSHHRPWWMASKLNAGDRV